MDSSTFDRIARNFGAAASRRSVVGGLAALLAGLGRGEVGAQRGAVAAAKQECKNKKKTRCPDGCVDLDKNRKNCGKCNHKCDPGERCHKGKCRSGTRAGCVCSTGCEFTSVQAAIDAASPGDTIELCAETFTENITIDKDLTLVGAGEGDTTLDGGGSGTVVALAPDITVEIRDLTISGGNSAGVGGGISNDSAQTTLDSVTVTGNHAGSRGGGIDINAGGSVTLINCTVSENTAATQGGGIYALGAVTLQDGTSVTGNESTGNGGGIYTNETATLTDCTISGNSTTTALTDGGGVYNDSGTLTVTNCTFSDNTGFRDGGGIYNAGGTADVSGSTFTDNVSNTNSGAALYNAGGGTMTVTDCDLTGGQSGDGGGGIYNNNSTLTVDGGSITNNHCDNAALGGGIQNNGGSASVTCTGGATLTGNTAGEPPVASNCVDGGGGTGCSTCATTLSGQGAKASRKKRGGRHSVGR